MKSTWFVEAFKEERRIRILNEGAAAVADITCVAYTLGLAVWSHLASAVSAAHVHARRAHVHVVDCPRYGSSGLLEKSLTPSESYRVGAVGENGSLKG